MSIKPMMAPDADESKIEAFLLAQRRRWFDVCFVPFPSQQTGNMASGPRFTRCRSGSCGRDPPSNLVRQARQLPTTRAHREVTRLVRHSCNLLRSFIACYLLHYLAIIHCPRRYWTRTLTGLRFDMRTSVPRPRNDGSLRIMFGTA